MFIFLKNLWHLKGYKYKSSKTFPKILETSGGPQDWLNVTLLQSKPDFMQPLVSTCVTLTPSSFMQYIWLCSFLRKKPRWMNSCNWWCTVTCWRCVSGSQCSQLQRDAACVRLQELILRCVSCDEAGSFYNACQVTDYERGEREGLCFLTDHR